MNVNEPALMNGQKKSDPFMCSSNEVPSKEAP
jgi:hypothetical protein